jgi:hypothetical protein
MWDGNKATTTHKTVHSWGYVIVNEMVCISGGWSGTRCWLQTSSTINYTTHITDSDDDDFDVYGLVKACKTQGTEPASHSGDSGAPVFTLDGNGVRAKGIVSAGDGTCMYFQDMADITTYRANFWYAASIVTA